MNTEPKDPGERDQAPDATPRARQRGRQARPRSAKPASPAQPHTRSHRPQWVIEYWISPQMRARNPNRPLTLCEVLEIGRTPEPREPGPDLELEAEP